ncbi:Clp protease [Skermania sp. ID1734]|uniref:Clp protease N-terminal domain-containing protein n=1 Tax=Skermania sp. ID1734 TaxID=2597516 RepID=UPI00117C1B68|nr:Clp protease N-terminal domain-containing protein [Skermania sp. ID1734]TSD95127.1 Clp protease [Skermania sp. ID1734]
MFERFTREARVIVVLAQEQARELGHAQIEPEHIVLGVLCRPSARLRGVIESSGLNFTEAVDTVRRMHADDPLGDDDAEALRAIGIDLDAVRESLRASFDDDVFEQKNRAGFARGHIRFSKAAKKSLELALREAVARKDNRIESEHLLLGILRAPNDVTRAVIEPHLPLDDLRARLYAALDEAA